MNPCVHKNDAEFETGTIQPPVYLKVKFFGITFEENHTEFSTLIGSNTSLYQQSRLPALLTFLILKAWTND